jgi:hypothetical protein
MIGRSRIGTPLRQDAARGEYQTSADALALFRAEMPAAPSQGIRPWAGMTAASKLAGAKAEASRRAPNEASCACPLWEPVKRPAKYFLTEQSYRSR